MVGGNDAAVYHMYAKTLTHCVQSSRGLEVGQEADL